jgi:hypothetical protein
MPFPWLFWRYGARIRGSCKYAAEAAAVLAKMMQQGAGQEQEKQGAVVPAGLPATESRAVLSEDETVVGEGEEVREERK